ncbi:hypothetical protein [Nocardiopsis tropica]|uniref:hypothetical protein n=1 Tax=Nocardiopsis tropica TaxID=109330 RepID=UPI0031D39821
MAHLIEQHGGAFPAWLAPVQLEVLPVSGDQGAEAGEFARRCAELDLRARVSPPDRGSLGARIRAARLVPYQAVVGARAAAEGTVSGGPRRRQGTASRADRR